MENFFSVYVEAGDDFEWGVFNYPAPKVATLLNSIINNLITKQTNKYNPITKQILSKN